MRSVLLVLLFALVLGTLAGLHPHPGAADRPDPDAGVVVVVARGDTLWSLARRHEPYRHPGATVEEIRRLNHLRGYTVHPGQLLRMP